ncbi:GGDEF domain-containing protein [Paucibacter sp. XJ19-41]|uniref:GGDEF domain-containing protein n=1 Tax=Paucibacter sp. XJ19-41 TaxID=2927824 RepID=UPI00234B93BA|nr:diguanylate cyclase [Paucibacter sp. XJ19-41]MDC6167008.1 diguanylate cyclase [Paucibacter sp. XJ19-41]
MQRPKLSRAWPPLAFGLVLALQATVLISSLGGWVDRAWLPWLSMASLGLSALVAGLALMAMAHARARAERAQRTLEEAIDALPASVEIFDAQDKLVAFNKRLVEIYPHMLREFERGASFEELARASLAIKGVPEAIGREEEWLTERKRNRGQQRAPLLQRVHGETWLRIFERRTPSGGMVGVRLEVSDLVHEQQRLAASQAHLQALINAATNGIVTLDTGGHMLEVNPACAQLFGFSAPELRGGHLSMLIQGVPSAPQDLTRNASLSGGSQEFSARHRDGRELAVHLSVAEVKTATTHLFVGIITDFSERKRQEMRLRQANELLARQSTTDGLTGVGNRRLFDQALQIEWQRSARSGKPLAMLLVDIDHFKQYNDHYGHVAGDDCLRRVATLLRSCVGRGGEPVCRYGGEEFAVLLVDTDLAGAQVVAQRILDSVRLAAIEHAASPVRHSVSLSIGVAARVAEAQLPALHLIELADAALYQAKQAGRARMVCSPLVA